MKYLVTKISLIDLNKEQFKDFVFQVHQIEKVDIQSTIQYFQYGWIIDLEDIIAFHIEQGYWSYEYIYHIKQHQVYISYDYQRLVEHIDMIEALINSHMIAKKEYFYVSQKPFIVDSFERFLEFVARQQRLPIVFLQYQTNDIKEKLANRLKGMAYVVKCEDEQIAYKIKNHFHLTKQNYVFYLNGECQKLSLLKNETEDEFINRIFLKVKNYITKRVYSFPYAMDELYRYALHQMIDDIKQNENSIAIDLENKISSLEKQKEEYTQRIQKLQNQISILQTQNDNMTEFMNQQQQHPLLIKGEEKELYLGEQKDIVLYLLEDRLKTIRDPHEKELIENILKDNPKVGKREQLLKEIQQLLMKSQQLNFNTIDKLKKCGIYLEKNNSKHYDCLFFNNSRYFLTVSSTPSDINYNRQIIRDIRKYFF